MPSSLRGAVLDLGSNSFKLFLAEQTGRRLVIFQEQALVTRLAEGIVETQKLKVAAIRRSLSKIREAAQAIQEFQPQKIFVSGTSALRSALNREKFIDPAEKILGQRIHIISGKREAAWAFAGITSHPKWSQGPLLSIDLGGGSLQFVEGEHGNLLFSKSLPLGAVRLRDRFFSHQPVTQTTLDQAKAFLQKKLSPITRKLHPQSKRVVAVGGTMSTLCLMSQKKPGHVPIHQLEGVPLTTRTLSNWIRRLAPLSLPDLRQIPGLPIDRADLALPGALVFLTILELLGIDSLYCATRGLRYGIWLKEIGQQPFSRIEWNHHESL